MHARFMQLTWSSGYRICHVVKVQFPSQVRPKDLKVGIYFSAT